MGIGFCIVLPQSAVDDAIDIIEKHRMSCTCIGHVAAHGSGEVQIKIRGVSLTL